MKDKLYTFYSFNFGDGNIEPIKLTRKEFKEMRDNEFAVFETYDDALDYAKGEE